MTGRLWTKEHLDGSVSQFEVPWPVEIRCKWCFDEKVNKNRAELRVQYSDTEYVQLCLGCWFKLAFS